MQTATGAQIRQVTPQLAGKQLLVKQGGNIIKAPGVQQQVVTLVKTSTGMTLATLPKGNIVQTKTTTGTVLPQQTKNTIVKIVPNVNKLLTKTIPSKVIQMNKTTGKLVLSKGTGQIPTLGNTNLYSSTLIF